MPFGTQRSPSQYHIRIGPKLETSTIDEYKEAVCDKKLWLGRSSVAPVAYQVTLEPGIGQSREFESPREHTRINSWGIFLVHKLTCGKRESVGQQHSSKLDEQWNC